MLPDIFGVLLFLGDEQKSQQQTKPRGFGDERLNIKESHGQIALIEGVLGGCEDQDFQIERRMIRSEDRG